MSSVGALLETLLENRFPRTCSSELLAGTARETAWTLWSYSVRIASTSGSTRFPLPRKEAAAKEEEVLLETKDDLIKSMDRFNNKYRLLSRSLFTLLLFAWRAVLDPAETLNFRFALPSVARCWPSAPNKPLSKARQTGHRNDAQRSECISYPSPNKTSEYESLHDEASSWWLHRVSHCESVHRLCGMKLNRDSHQAESRSLKALTLRLTRFTGEVLEWSNSEVASRSPQQHYDF